MRILSIVILTLIFASCSENKQASQDNQLPSAKDSVVVNINTVNKTDEFEEQTHFDSLHFSVVRRKHANGKPYIESISNKKTKLDSWKEYYNNGLLKKLGQMTTSTHRYIGKWKYYSDHGELDSIVDYDIKQAISYFKVIDIAKENGFEMPDMEVIKTYTEGKMQWEVNRWTVLENGGGQSAETILVDSKTGKVSKPESQRMAIF